VIRVGHRGAAAHAPGNTWASFRRAIEIGVDMIEVDVRRSGDGHLVLAHDETLPGPAGEAECGGGPGSALDGANPCTVQDAPTRRWRDPPGPLPVVVAESSLSTLRALDLGGGERLVTLSEAIHGLRGQCALMIDLKGEGFERELVAAIREGGLSPSEVVIPGGTEPSRRAIRALDPGLPLSLSLDGRAESRLSPEFLEGIDTDAVTWHHRLITPERVARLRARGLTVYAWTVDDLETMRRVHDAGVDGIITNRPELFREMAPPAPQPGTHA
jgi:glycerophosphoryl diester phosphodiesterase